MPNRSVNVLELPLLDGRLTQLLRNSGMMLKELADRLGVSNAALSKARKRGRIRAELLDGICAEFNVDRGYFAGELAAENGDYQSIPYREAEASMGGGSPMGSRRILSFLGIRKEQLLSRTSNLDRLSIIHSDGDSMAPTIPFDSNVLIDESSIVPVNDEIYFFLLNDEYLIKRIRTENGKAIGYISDNGGILVPFGEDDHIEILGRVIGIFKWF